MTGRGAGAAILVVASVVAASAQTVADYKGKQVTIVIAMASAAPIRNTGNCSRIISAASCRASPM